MPRESRAYDVVIHLAAHLSKDPGETEAIFRTNVEGTVNLLREMSPQVRLHLRLYQRRLRHARR